MTTLALCINLSEIQRNFRDRVLCKKYPGSGYIPHLVAMAEKVGWIVKGGDDALADIIHGYRSASDVVILQEEFNPSGLKLIELGAKAQVVVCMESKMYAPHFYDAIPWFKKAFKYQILFEGGTHPLYFPSYDKDENHYYPGIENKKRICMISSNKQWWAMSNKPWDSPSFCSAIRNELHSARLKAIEDHPDMDLYGYGWDNLNNIPPHWAHLKSAITRQWKGICEDKLETLSQYRYTICIENTNEPGYITEKIPHAVLVGCEGFDDFWRDRNFGNYSNEHFADQVIRLLNA